MRNFKIISVMFCLFFAGSAYGEGAEPTPTSTPSADCVAQECSGSNTFELDACQSCCAAAPLTAFGQGACANRCVLHCEANSGGSGGGSTGGGCVADLCSNSSNPNQLAECQSCCANSALTAFGQGACSASCAINCMAPPPPPPPPTPPPVP